LANHKSAFKRIRQNEKRRLRNKHVKSTMKGCIKNFLKSIEDNNPETAKDNLHTAIVSIDSAASKGIIHKNNASRKISRLQKKFNTLESSPG
jgi:small subunit ribosomal protein S20